VKAQDASGNKAARIKKVSFMVSSTNQREHSHHNPFIQGDAASHRPCRRGDLHAPRDKNDQTDDQNRSENSATE